MLTSDNMQNFELFILYFNSLIWNLNSLNQYL